MLQRVICWKNGRDSRDDVVRQHFKTAHLTTADWFDPLLCGSLTHLSLFVYSLLKTPDFLMMILHLGFPLPSLFHQGDYRRSRCRFCLPASWCFTTYFAELIALFKCLVLVREPVAESTVFVGCYFPFNAPFQYCYKRNTLVLGCSLLFRSR